MAVLIRPFTEPDLPDAGKIALQLWGDEVPDMPESMKPCIYQYLVRYYFVPESEFNLAAEENGKLCGFLLGAPSGFTVTDHAERWLEPQLKTAEEFRIYREYKAYIDGNRHAEEKYTRPEDLVLLLFASIRKGAGRLLMSEMTANTIRAGFKSHLLWTDETCDFSYYFRNGYAETARFPAPAPLFGKAYDTWIFRHELKE